MIDTKEQYEEYGSPISFMYSSDDWGTFWDADIRPTIEALREVAREAKRAEKFNPGYLTPAIMRTVDALPDWLTE